MIYNSRTVEDLIKAFGYAKRLLETAKFGIIVNVSEKKQKRSIKQNRYYRGIIIIMMSNHSGYFPEEMHQIMKQEFLRLEDKIINGKKYLVTKSTTELNTAEFEEYNEKCRMYASINMKICIPLPNELPDDWENSIK